ncbi:DUF255 domain-containing protein [Methylobacterium brachythecii]|uniref:Thioredoxin domain-containing protein n=1 Tax=Methylobacterium brachythecii TaxID=1176177 RepID=A0A7W6F8V9_9HYPH|nr:DUF255 domain-containing protein [Methylobacterium brachythecii]MBB3904521.1 hypothetical protein [Methylobacterium brachythecii]GLS45815.1 hypothetical protein GCM10007884_38060 [Methylobacterium brachythecii]
MTKVLAAAVLIAGIMLGGPASAAEPIQWTGWSADLFARAKAQNRLVILDLEAVWCHWCHVMEQKTYANETVSGLISAKFIAVRADQDASPDLSSRYGDWGWPATIVFAPDGTEIAKLRGFVEPERMAALLKAAIEDPTPGPSVSEALKVVPAESHTLGKEQLTALNESYEEAWDEENAGWGQPLKYIDADSFDLAMARAETGDKTAEARARRTLDKGLALIDPVWGGVYQYSDKLDWSSPHFEKIMSFQAQDLRQYSQAYARWHDPKYRDAAAKIAGYLTGFLKSPEGAFYVSQDADLSHEVDGHVYYALGDADRRAKGIPRIDTHLYARENGWAIAGLVAYANAFDDAEALKTAETAARWVQANRALPGSGFRHGTEDRGGPFLGDTLAMGQAFLDLYAATGDRAWLASAQGAGGFIAKTFKDEAGGFNGAAKAESDVLANPPKSLDDQIAIARFLNLLAQYTGSDGERALALHAMRYVAGAVTEIERPLAGALLADRELNAAPTHLTVVGPKGDPAARQLQAAARALPAVYKRLDWWDRGEGRLANPDVDYPELDRPAAFACSGHLCSLPTFTAADLKTAVAQMEEQDRARAAKRATAPAR